MKSSKLREPCHKPTPDSNPRRTRDGSTLARVRAVSRAIHIMRAFTPERRHLALAEIVRATGLDAGTTRRILVTLRDESIVRQDENTGLYCLSLDMLQIAGAVPEGNSLRELTQSRLVRLARDTGVTVFLSILRNDSAICLARYHGDSAVQVRWWSVGGKLPLNCGAGPKVLLAHMPDSQSESFLKSNLTQLTAKSTIDAACLRQELDSIRETGWAITHDDVAVGLSALAIPLMNADGDVLAAVSVGGLTAQITGEGSPRCLDDLLRCGQDLTTLVRSITLVSLLPE